MIPLPCTPRRPCTPQGPYTLRGHARRDRRPPAVPTLAATLATLLAPPLAAQCCSPDASAEVVIFHARGAWPARIHAVPPDDATLAAEFARLLAGAPPTVRAQGTNLWVGLRDHRRPETYQVVLLHAGLGVRRVLQGGVRDLRPAPNGAIAVVTAAGAIAVADAGGGLTEICGRGRTPVWNDAGTELLFVAERSRQEGDASDPSAVCSYRPADRTVVELARGDSDFFPVAHPRTGDVIFASGRTRMAAFWRIRPGDKEPTQVCNFGWEMDAAFVPMPRRTPITDEAHDRLVYEIDYGDGSEIWALTLAGGSSRSPSATRLAKGSEPVIEGALLRFVDEHGRAVELPLAELPTTATDFGLRKEVAAQAANVPPTPSPAATGFFSPIKVEFPLIYNAYKCNSGGRNSPGHPGHDFDAPRFLQQYAAGDGVVTEWQDGWGAGTGSGNFVTIRHDWMDRSTVYWHLQAGTVWPAPRNAPVGVGMPIGRTGDSGGSSNIPHVHFGVFDEDWFTQNWNDPTGFYAVDKLAWAPDRYAPSWRSPGSCGLVQLPIPDYVRLAAIDSLPPTFSNPRLVRTQDLGADVMLHFEMDIADPSGVFDEGAVPTPSNPHARGVYVVLNPIEAANPPGSRTSRIPMSLRTGDRFRGTYRTDYPVRVRKGRATAPDVDLITWAVVAEDEALRNFAFRGIGNGGYSGWLSVTEVQDGDDDLAAADLTMVDLSAEITEVPARITADVPFELAIRVHNRSRIDYRGGYTGTVGLNPIRDIRSPMHVPLGAPFLVPPLRAGASTTLRLGPYTAPGPLLLAPQHLIVSLDAPNDPDPGSSADRRLVHVVPGLPDLVLVDLRADGTIGHGERLTVSGRIRNLGVVPARGRVQIGLGLSLDRIPNNGNDIPLGLFEIDLGTLAPEQSVGFDMLSLVVPPSALPGPQYLIAGVDTGFWILELDEFNNLADSPVQVVGPEVGITAVEPLATGIGGTGSIPVRVTLRNSGRGTAHGNVRVTITNGNVTNSGDALFSVGPEQTVQVQTSVLTPPVFGLQRGQWVMAPVVACHNFIDPVPGNNCADTTVRIDCPYWDLRLSIDGPQTMGRTQWHTWSVRLHNAGNVWSEGRCVRSGISLYPGENWGTPTFILNECGPGPIQTLSFGSIAPGTSITLGFGMHISRYAQVGWQYLKVGIDAFNNCHDIYPEGNYDERMVYIQ